jgi:hypothetical protein
MEAQYESEQYETTRQLTGDQNEDTESCFKFEIIDNSEPLLIIGFIASISGFGISIIAGTVGLSIITGVVSLSTLVAEWRVRTLGIAKNLMDSVKELRDENDKLQGSVFQLDLENGKLKDEVNKFEKIVGILDDNVEDIESAKKQLFELYEKYKEENLKQESNNLLTLFGLVDKNEDSKLSPKELERLNEYIKIVYKQEIDFSVLDKDNNGYVSLQEFFEKFRGKLHKK